MTTQDKLIKSKLNLLELGSYLGNVSEACRTLGYSRDTFYRLKKRYEEDGLEGLREISRRKPNRRNRVPEEIEEAVVHLALEYPAFGQVRAADKLISDNYFCRSRCLNSECYQHPQQQSHHGWGEGVESEMRLCG